MSRTDLAVVPITESDAAVEHVLADANVLALVAAALHLGADPAILRGPLRPRRFVFNELDGGLTGEELAQLRKQALHALRTWRLGGAPEPAVPPLPVLRDLMDWLAAEHVGDEEAALFLEEMDLAGIDPRRVEVREPEALSVLVVGAGMSGLLAAVRLQQAGMPFEVVEKDADVGGTWYENTYPGCRVDVPSHYYCYSFEPADFTEHYARQPELHAYFRRIVERYGLSDRITWRTEVERMAWDDDTGVWRVTTRDADGNRGERTATAVISAVGQLNRPFVPDLPHLDRFTGPVFHSSRWAHHVDLRGKRVALIGAGASGFQIAPAIADDVDHLVVFQRSAQWMMPNRLYHRPVEAGTRWAMAHVPGYERWYRFLLLWQATDKMLEVVRVDPAWPGLPLSANAASDRFRRRVMRWIDEHVGDDRDLVEKVVPNYPPLGKRLLQDDGSWLRCLARDDVELVRDDIVDIESDAVLTAQSRYQVDVIVLATGFRANDFLYPMRIVGREGRELHDLWDGRPAAYLGITVPEFPNMFLMYGPGTNLAHAGSVIFQAECQLRYVGGCLALIASTGGGTVEPTQGAYEEYVERLQDELSRTVWAHPSVRHSWYKAADGRVYVLSPWRLVDYWKMTAAPDRAAHVVRPPRRAP